MQSCLVPPECRSAGYTEIMRLVDGIGQLSFYAAKSCFPLHIRDRHGVRSMPHSPSCLLETTFMVNRSVGPIMPSLMQGLHFLARRREVCGGGFAGQCGACHAAGPADAGPVPVREAGGSRGSRGAPACGRRAAVRRRGSGNCHVQPAPRHCAGRCAHMSDEIMFCPNSSMPHGQPQHMLRVQRTRPVLEELAISPSLQATHRWLLQSGCPPHAQ